MQEHQNKYHRALMTVAVTVYGCAILTVCIGLYLLSGRMAVPQWQLVGFVIFIVSGLILIAGLRGKREWARKIVLALALFGVIQGSKAALADMMATFMVTQIIKVPIDAMGSAISFLLTLALALTP